MDLVSSQKHRRLPSFEIFYIRHWTFWGKGCCGRRQAAARQVWVLHQQRKVPCKNRHRRCLATSEVTFCQNPSPAFLTRKAQQCSIALHLEQDRINQTTLTTQNPIQWWYCGAGFNKIEGRNNRWLEMSWLYIMNGRGAIFQIDLSQQSLLNNLYLSQSVEGTNTLNNNIFFLISNIL